MHLRHARPEDAAAIAAIYNHAVEHTTAIWNEATVDVQNRVAWIADRQDAGFPVRVAVDAPEGEEGEGPPEARPRVCDASVFPEIIGSHTMAPAVVVAEKCADLLKAAWL